MNSVLKNAQSAMFSAISADATIMGKITGVFDYPPKDQAYPFVAIGESTSVPFRTHSQPGEEVTVTIHIWSVYEGFSEALDILGDLNRLFGDVDLAVSGWSNIHSWYDFSETLREGDGELRHVVARYRLRALQD